MSKSNPKDIISSLVMSKHDKSNLMQLLNKVENGGSSGGGIQIVDSEEKLNSLNVPIGSPAVVAVPGTIKESSFRDLYQPDASILDQSTGTITTPELLSNVSSLKVTAPEGNIKGVLSGVYIIPRDFSQSNPKMIAICIEVSDNIVTRVGVMTMIDSYNSLSLITYNDGIPTVDNSAIETINNYLASGDWCYFGNPESATGITEEQFNIIDMFVKAVQNIPSTAEIYIKEDNWEKLNKKELQEITYIKNELNNKVTPIELNSENWFGTVSPNIYYKRTITSGSNINRFICKNDSTKYEEFIFEIKCENNANFTFEYKDGTPIIWANDDIPEFAGGMTYLISIVNGLAVYSMFFNE